MKNLYLFLIAAVILTSCGRPKTTTQPKDTAKIIKVSVLPPPPLHEDMYAPKYDTIHKLSNYTITRFFSDTLNKDNFRITLYGKSVKDGTLVFEIFNSQKRRIYQNICNVTDLIFEYNSLKPKQQADTVQSIMKHFFDEENFHQPAIGENEKIGDDMDNYDKTRLADWNEIKADPKAIGFSYQHNYETITTIAFSKKQKEAVIIFYVE